MSNLTDQLRDLAERVQTDEGMEYLEKMLIKFYLQDLIAEEEMKEFFKEDKKDSKK